MNPKRPTPRHIIIKLLRIKMKNLKSSKRKMIVTYKRAPTRPSVDFSTETLLNQKGWHKIFQVMKSRDL